MCDSVAGPHIVGRGSINSGSSASDLSEAISDMSLSTSPGSDLPTSVSSNMSDIMSNNRLIDNKNKGLSEDSKPTAYPRKKRVMRQLSSNPYLASSEMSPDDQVHPVILGANSYAGEPPEVFDGFCSNEEMNSSSTLRFRAKSYPLASDFVTNSDDSEEENSGIDDSGGKNMIHNQTIHFNGNPNCGHNNFHHNENLAHFNHQSFVCMEPPSSFQNEKEIVDFSHFHHNNSSSKAQSEAASYKRFDYNHPHFNHHNYHHNEKESSILNTSTEIRSNYCYASSPVTTLSSYHHPSPNTFIPTSESCPPGQPSINNVQLRREKERHQSESGTYSTNRHHDYQPQSREINSWGHFSKHTERHYKYRRSHCNSSDSDDENQRYYRNNQTVGVSSDKSNSHPHTHKNTDTHSSSSHNYNRHSHNKSSLPSVNNSSRVTFSKNQNEVCAKKEPSEFDGVKPQIFKDRFQFMKRWFADCNDGQKNVILKGLLKLCDLPQLHLLSVHMSRELHHGCPSNCEDILTWLPTNLATKVMTYLDPVSLCRAAQVCSVWRSLAVDQSLWRRFCCQTKWRLSKAAEHKQVISHMSAEGSIQWKNVFAERFRLRNNWLKGRRTVRTFEGHHQGISCVQFDDSRIVSGSSDKTIKVWNMRTNAPWSVQTLMGHHGTVRCLHLEGNRLVSGSCDTTIKVWDLSTEESWSSIACKVTMTGHSDTVRCLQADDDKVISGSYDKTLKIWDLKSGELRQTLRGHQGSVLCVHFSETKIVSGSVDKTIKVWNHEGSCMNTLCGHQDAVTCLMFDSTRIVSGSLDHNLKFWDVHSGECLNTIDWKMAEGHTGVVRCLQADSWRVVSAGDDKTIKVWNLATGERLVTLRDHTDGVTCLQFNDFIIVSGSYDKTVKLWDFSCC